MQASNAIRLGVGHYENVDAIWDPQFGRWLPPTATDIVMHTHINGYHARFKIDRKSLDDWFDQVWFDGREWAARPREEPSWSREFEPAEIERLFGKLGDWQPPEGTKWTVYAGPEHSNAAGAVTWFDEKSGVAYQKAAFW